MNLKEIKQRFEAKYPKGWRVKGNKEPRWVEFCDGDTDVGGQYSEYDYYTNFHKEDNRIIFYYKSGEDRTLISVDEFFSLWNNTNQENNYEIY